MICLKCLVSVRCLEANNYSTYWTALTWYNVPNAITNSNNLAYSNSDGRETVGWNGVIVSSWSQIFIAFNENVRYCSVLIGPFVNDILNLEMMSHVRTQLSGVIVPPPSSLTLYTHAVSTYSVIIVYICPHMTDGWQMVNPIITGFVVVTLWPQIDDHCLCGPEN